jgi:tetratricopeptide (TPR) repeat protein
MKRLLLIAPLCAVVFSTACMQSPQKLVAAGNRYHDKQKYTEASILYQKAITKDKTYAEAYYRQGLNLLDLGEPVNAAKFLRRAVDLQPTNVDAAMKLAEIYLSAYSSDPRKFKPLLAEVHDLDAKIMKSDPNSFNGFRLQGLLALAENNRDKALESFAKANQIKPHSPELVWWYAEALANAGRRQEAEALVRDMLNHDPKWGRGYDFLFLLYARENDRQKAEAVLRERVKQDPSSVVGTENLANYLLANNRYPEAEATIKPLLDDKKKFPTGHQAVGDFYFRAKKYDQALQQYQAGLKEDPKNKTQYNQRIVGVYEATGRNDDALRLAKQMADDEPKNTAANELYAGLLLRTGTQSNLSKSLDELKNMVQNSPTDGLLHLDLARVYYASKQPDKALTEALDAMQYEAKAKAPRAPVLTMSRLIAARIYEDRGQHAKAIEQTSMLLQIDPRNPDARLIRDRAQIASNNIEPAQADLEMLVQQVPQMAEAHLQLGNLYLNQKQFDKASAEFGKVWKMNPPDVRGFIGLQTIKLAQGKGEDGIQALEDLLQQNPKDLNLRYQLAMFESRVGAEMLPSNSTHGKELLQEAANNYKEILKTKSDSADVWVRLGAVQRQLGQFDAALASFEQASNADPRDAAAALNQALLLEALGKKKEAGAAYSKVLGIDPENPLALNNLAYLNAENGTNLDQAMTFAQRAKKRVPNSPDISDTLGYVYYQKNLNAEALQIFRQVVQDNPQNSTFRFHLAMALEKQGNKQAARDEAQKALKNSSRPDQQNKIRSFLSQLG